MPRARLETRPRLRAGFRAGGRELVRYVAVALALCAVLACRQKEASTDERPSLAEQPSVSAPPARQRRTAPTAVFSCSELRPIGGMAPSETIELAPPRGEKQLVLSKTGVVVSFGRDEALAAARCLNLGQAVRYIEQETGEVAESPLMDAFQLSYVAAALLDAGRASARRWNEAKPSPSVVRDAWSADGCAGRCRSSGRLYRLAEGEPFFLRITDKTENENKNEKSSDI
jgi:hypothetical protein